jgi:hypothetical protein
MDIDPFLPLSWQNLCKASHWKELWKALVLGNCHITKTSEQIFYKNPTNLYNKMSFCL